jgi:hypothetical protein
MEMIIKKISNKRNSNNKRTIMEAHLIYLKMIMGNNHGIILQMGVKVSNNLQEAQICLILTLMTKTQQDIILLK